MGIITVNGLVGELVANCVGILVDVRLGLFLTKPGLFKRLLCCGGH
jgi:hypothetical protein